MNFANYQSLCAAMGAAQKEGHNLEADWELLDSSIQALIGSFSAGAYFNVQQIIRGSSNLELNDTAAARDAINDLCRRYGVPLVCDPNETTRRTAADVARKAAELLLGEGAG